MEHSPGFTDLSPDRRMDAIITWINNTTERIELARKAYSAGGEMEDVSALLASAEAELAAIKAGMGALGPGNGISADPMIRNQLDNAVAELTALVEDAKTDLIESE